MSSSTSQQASSSTEANPPPHPPSYDDIRQQAGPLPSKRGEIGFVEGVHVQTPTRQEFAINLPARHPADRGNEETVAVPLTPAPNGTFENGQPTSNAAPSTPSQPQTQPEPEDKGLAVLLFAKLRPKPIKVVQGIRLSTLLAFLAQFLVFTGCIIAWVFTANKLASLAQNGGKVPGGIGSAVFLHVIFAFAVIGQLIFLERRVYRMRAERYAHLHPGEMLPRYRDRSQPGGDISFAFAPWNRPPLPTYAAVLAQSGLGTGDVDDHLIAVPPPPAYGNTRGSTLLLSGFLRDSLRAQRPPSVHSDLERGGEGGSSGNAEVNREGHLQQTLARLETRRSNR
ncbi:hypothetical protein FA13DRAFT_49790 [Coprinellus micaceus]|uniref:Uncharacterized protein n=1 Tax=Coprinellus micaceus TaxID=71717 RepID=A0A4Y7U2I2_COPMI|nr:hypothetical protein FA13DRAFT_49790 [Coprinellus micaceus]